MVAVIALVGAAAAGAATDGTYVQGNTKKGSGIKLTVASDQFSVKIVRFKETCHYGDRTIHDFFTFKSGSQAHITGPVNADGTFSGKYSSNAGKVKVSGTISGPSATVKAVESGPYNFASTTHPNFCRGSHTFQANLPTG